MHTQQQLLSALRLEETGVPIYVQLREQLRAAIGAGLLQPGQQMPTMRQVAVALKIDLNTVRHAYDELERMGVVVLARGRGSFVAEAPSQSADDAEDRTLDLARQTLAAAALSGVDPGRLAERILALAAMKEETR
ncbi:GntR family transcriptional regulator [Phenylobacterium montanum]|uniref:GntR family transcriptional regulator n=1 Tax=Phenylobacterium montanum TaxID=2823693 RepID=A0A975FXI5_9CAUL|nr:GntR family transcriptional regulator [Caulobacter sp. S6]QUD86126.1 GntR family transcriptional regulator [Caulobacter sp. S6]